MTTGSSGPAPGWYPDPSGQHDKRYWDGSAWTEQVTSRTSDPGSPLMPAPHGDPFFQASDPAKIEKQVQQQAGVAPVYGGGGTLLSEPVLVVNQKAKLIELTNEYAVFDQTGNQLGSVVQVGQSALRKVFRLISSYDQFLPIRLEVRDQRGMPVLHLHRPGKIFKSKIIVTLPSGAEVGRIVQQNVFGKIRFGFEVGGQPFGGVNAENWRAWNFSIVDGGGTEVARVTKTWEGLAKTMFTTADKYVVQIHRPLDDPLRSLVVASALCVDTALKQDSRGIS